jgi:hypothetical protein
MLERALCEGGINGVGAIATAEDAGLASGTGTRVCGAIGVDEGNSHAAAVEAVGCPCAEDTGSDHYGVELVADRHPNTFADIRPASARRFPAAQEQAEKRYYSGVRILLLLLVPTILPAADCSELAKLTLPHTKIAVAEAVTTGSFKPEGGNGLDNLPPFCRVAGSIQPTADSDIQFEAWMPLQNWNEKFQGTGNGGFAGSLSYGAIAGALRQGYAAATTDTGHKGGGTDARWALNHPEKIIDFGWRGIHEMTVQSKALIRAFYGKGPKRSYFNSCSNGGRQALMEAQRFPEDYDGIIAGAPANYFTRQVALSLAIISATHKTPQSYIPPTKLAAIQSAVDAACDASDGVKDGVIENPVTCRPDYSKLLCQGAEDNSCLTRAQLDALMSVHQGLRDEKGKVLYPPLSPGGEAHQAGWAAWITGGKPEQGAHFAFATNFFKYFVYGDANWDFRTADLQAARRLAEQKHSAALDAINPDLSKFHGRGGKLILYHGWCDAAIPAQNAIDYYKSVERKMGKRRTGHFVRLLMAPGVQHCSAGDGPFNFGQGGPRGGAAESDLNAALERWVEQGVAPESVIASKPGRTRPLCAYPQQAAYRGSGDTDAAQNFQCK